MGRESLNSTSKTDSEVQGTSSAHSKAKIRPVCVHLLYFYDRFGRDPVTSIYSQLTGLAGCIKDTLNQLKYLM